MAQKSSIQQALYLAILRDLTLELCFDAFKARESNRLPCSLCGKFCRQYGKIITCNFIVIIYLSLSLAHLLALSLQQYSKLVMIFMDNELIMGMLMASS